MRILHVNHGYPPRYNAGSEVHCRDLVHALARLGHQLSVFSREEDPYQPDFVIRVERDGDIPVHVINMPRTQSRWQHQEVDDAFARVIDEFRPDAVHFHHLNHLSVGLPKIASTAGAKVVFTAHDFWLACPRGQFVQWRMGGTPWPLCPGQEDLRCAESCYARSYSGAADQHAADLVYWRDWVGARMAAIEAQLAHVDVLVSPSRTVATALTNRFPQLGPRVIHRDYGFPRLPSVERTRNPVFTFGYLGTHVATKGIDLLLRAFRRLHGPARLRIFGRPRGQETESLRRIAAGDDRVSFEGEYENTAVARVLSGLDAIVVPSIWLENSPLVIHEAQQARVCVVTADAGGMAEYVAHEINGLTFRHRDETSLAQQLQRLVDDPQLAPKLGARGYLHSVDGEVPDIDLQARQFMEIYSAPRKGAEHAA